MIDTRVEPLIDLGDMHAVPPEPEQPARPRAGVWRAATASLSALIALGGSTVPVAPLTPTATHVYGIGSSFAVDGDRLFATRSNGAAAWTLAAVELPDGRELWRTPYDVHGGRIVRIATVGEIVLAVGGDNGGEARRSIAYEAASGRRLWTVDDDVVALADDRTGIVSRDGGTGLVGLDLRTGRRLWTAALPGPSVVEPLDRADGRLLVLARSGTVQLRDAARGAVLRAVEPFDAGQVPIAAVPVGGAAVLWYVGAGGTGIVGLDPQTLAVRWWHEHPVEGGGFAACAALLCVSGDGGVDALDPSDGRLVWHTDPARYVVDLGAQLVVLDEASGGIGAVRTVDPATGMTVSDLSGWRTGTRGGDPVLALTPAGDGYTVLAVLGPPSGVVHSLGAVPGVALSCQRGRTAVVCRMTTGELRIWRLGRPG
ncbi:MAG TPA: PQQ-binding-like beta-propeller repeat protein [Asanoa sp.]